MDTNEWYALYQRENERNKNELLEMLNRVASFAKGVAMSQDFSKRARQLANSARAFALEIRKEL